LIQNSADVLKNVPSRIAVSPVIPLSSFCVDVIRLGGTLIAFASAFAVMALWWLKRCIPEDDR
jgi:hypothetical protein